VLIGFGLFTVFSAFRGHKRREASVDILASVKGLFIIALGLSLDNLFVGFSLGLGEVNPLLLAGYIAICSAVFTYAGLKLGRYIKYSFGKYVEVFAGLVLIVLGLINF
jgi:putative Mn2+ efflux pump MntP